MIAGRMKEMKVRAGLTNKQVSELSGVPIATVNRVMSDQVQNPTFETISAIVMAMGCSIDEVIDYVPTMERADDEDMPKEGQADSQSQQMQNGPAAGVTPEVVHTYELLLAERTKIIESKDQIIAEKDLWIKRLFITSCLLVGIIIAVLLLDLFNPSVGFFRR